MPLENFFFREWGHPGGHFANSFDGHFANSFEFHLAAVASEMAEVVRSMLQVMSNYEGEYVLEPESDHKPPSVSSTHSIPSAQSAPRLSGDAP